MIGNEQLQIAIWNKLEGAGLTTYAFLPGDVPYPFVCMTDETLDDTPSTKGRKHYDVRHTIHTFSKSDNKAEVNSMNSTVIETLSQPFALADGFYMSRCKLERMVTLRDPTVDGVFHGNIEFLFTISKGVI